MFPRLKMSYLLIGLHHTERVSPALCGTGKKKGSASSLFADCVEGAPDLVLRFSHSES